MVNAHLEIEKKIYIHKGKYGIDANMIVISRDIYNQLEIHGNLIYECLKPTTYKGIPIIVDANSNSEDFIRVGFME
jgi:hypothetical protein